MSCSEKRGMDPPISHNLTDMMITTWSGSEEGVKGRQSVSTYCPTHFDCQQNNSLTNKKIKRDNESIYR